MSSADAVTASRLVLAPLFFAVFFLPGIPPVVAVPLLWLLFILIEVSDLVDGALARKSGTVSSFGKLFDPFADVVARLTYFLCFALGGLMPAWVLLLILYREFGIMFLRQLLSTRGIAMGARPGGKLKAVIYMTAGAASLLLITISSFGFLDSVIPALRILVMVLYVASALLSVLSFIDYLRQFRILYGKV